MEIYFIEGNHDFGFEHFGSEFLNQCLTAYGDMIISFKHPQLGNVTLLHGDQVICPSSYLWFRSFVKAYTFQWIVTLLFSGRFMHFIFSRYAKISRKKDRYRILDTSFMRSCIKKFLNQKNPKADVLIFGHIHFLVDENIEGAQCYCGPDWFSKPSYLRTVNSNSAENLLQAGTKPETQMKAQITLQRSFC